MAENVTDGNNSCDDFDSLKQESSESIFKESAEEMTKKSGSNDTTLCEVCLKEKSKYTCPGCGLKTCSVSCVKEHKVKLNCSGERNKFAWVDISQYSDRHLLNDYRFLENAERSVYSNKMVPRNRHLGSAFHHMPYQQQSKRSKILMSAAGRRKIRLRIMPNNLARHKSNTSFYTIKSDLLEWHIEWLFVSSNCLVTDEKVPETTVLLEACKKFGNAVTYPHLRKALEDYKKSFHLCRYLIKVEGLPANRKRFVELKPSLTIAENLTGLSLVEFPTIHVLPPSYESEEFPLLDKDEDLTHMHTAHMKHLATNHPDYSHTHFLETQLLDQNSSIYKADDTVDLTAEGSA